MVISVITALLLLDGGHRQAFDRVVCGVYQRVSVWRMLELGSTQKSNSALYAYLWGLFYAFSNWK